jgi:hypothetical protein
MGHKIIETIGIYFEFEESQGEVELKKGVKISRF